jgi:hypothetical protein
MRVDRLGEYALARANDLRARFRPQAQRAVLSSYVRCSPCGTGAFVLVAEGAGGSGGAKNHRSRPAQKASETLKMSILRKWVLSKRCEIFRNRRELGGASLSAMPLGHGCLQTTGFHISCTSELADPMTMLIRENALQAHLMRWDDARGHYVLTGTGRRRISAGSRAPGAVVSFRRRGLVNGGAPQRKPENPNLEE